MFTSIRYALFTICIIRRGGNFRLLIMTKTIKTTSDIHPSFMITAPIISFVKKILVLGAECTGKSTLVEDMGAYFDAPIVKEYMRTYLSKKPVGYVCQWHDLLPIAIGQINSENQAVDMAIQQQSPYVFCDTALFEIMVYSQWYFNDCPPDIKQHAIEHRYDLVLLTDNIGIPWAADGMRDLPNEHDKMRQSFVDFLDLYQINFVEISGDRTTRLQKVVHLLHQFDAPILSVCV